MNKNLLSLAIVVLFAAISAKKVAGQELPVVTQKMTNTFLYNPSLAGLDGGFATFTHQTQWADLAGNPTVNYASVQTPLVRGKLGVGFNFFSDKINVFRTTNLSMSAAYHLNVTPNIIVSAGLTGEVSRTRLDLTDAVLRDIGDPLLENFTPDNLIDYSAGINIRMHDLGGVGGMIDLGGSLNRLNTFFTNRQDGQNLPDFYTLYANLYVPMFDGRDWLEPRINLRQQFETESLLDLGIFYTYNNTIIGGATYRSNNMVNLSGGVILGGMFTVAYGYEMFLDELTGEIGPSSEIILKIDFNQGLKIQEMNERSNYGYRRGPTRMTNRKRSIRSKMNSRSKGYRGPAKRKKNGKRRRGAPKRFKSF